NGGIFRFAGAMRNNGRVVIFVGYFNSIHLFSKRTDLVNLNQDGVSYALLNAPRQTFGIGHKKIITYQLYTIANGIGQLLPAVPVVFIQCIFNGYDGIFIYLVGPESNHIIIRSFASVARAKVIDFLFSII